ncbi:MAG: DUF2231 domain-containing protein [Desulfobacterales bacterium]
MFNFVYKFLASLGYTHPIHPTEVHMPIGLVVGSFIFAFVAVIFKRPQLREAVKYCIILAFIWVFPTMLFGYMDWQHFYAGAWLFPIKVKIPLAFTLLVLLGIAIIVRRKKGAGSIPALILYTLCFMVVVVLGYFGGQLTYGTRAASISPEFKTGEKLFKANCSACHPNGKNAILPNFPIVGSDKLASFDTFSTFVRNPKLPSGKSGPMPKIMPSKLTDKQLKEIYEYLVNELAKGSK